MNRMVLRVLGYGVGLFLVGHLAACSSVDVPQPTPLKPLEPLLSVSEVWQAPLGGEVGDGLRMAAHDNLLAAATLDGLLRVIDTETGEDSLRFSTRETMIYASNTTTFTQFWRKCTPPAFAPCQHGCITVCR